MAIREGLRDDLLKAFALVTDVNSRNAYRGIDQLLVEVGQDDRRALANTFLGKTAVGDTEHSLAGLAFHLDPSVGGS